MFAKRSRAIAIETARAFTRARMRRAASGDPRRDNDYAIIPGIRETLIVAESYGSTRRRSSIFTLSLFALLTVSSDARENARLRVRFCERERERERELARVVRENSLPTLGIFPFRVLGICPVSNAYRTTINAKGNSVSFALIRPSTIMEIV